eukprot:3329706-Prymnesium_polylepis.1
MLGLSFLVAMLLSHFVEHSAPTDVRAGVNAHCAAHHNVAFIGNFLDAGSTYELACDIGEPDPSSVALFDTGAAVNASIGRLPVLKGS